MTFFRSFLNGALAIAGITAAFGFATEAQAAEFFSGTVGQVRTSGFSTVVGDKRFSDFSIPIGTGQFQTGDAVSISDSGGGSFDVLFSALGATPNTVSAPGTITYKVTILDPEFVFGDAGTSTGLTGGTRSVTRNTTISDLLPGDSPLVSSNGSMGSGTFKPGITTINVSDSWSFGTTGTRSITSLTTTLNQVLAPGVPEPSAVLGLLALGLCGTLVGRQKKG